jgi:hypothetical protein
MIKKIESLTENDFPSFLIRNVKHLDSGYVRIGTCFLLPDCDLIDVFLPKTGELKLTDLGTTLQWLSTYLISFNKQASQQTLEGIFQTYGVECVNGCIEFKLNSLDDVNEGIMSLAQACLSVANLMYAVKRD